MGYGLLKNILVFAALLMPGACSSSGIVPADINLSLADVVVTQSGKVNEGPRFSHELREEIRYEFSRAALGEKEARIFLEVRELAYNDMSANGYKQGANTMASYGRLVDAVTGEGMGEFPLEVVSADVGADTTTSMGRQHVRSDMIRLTARATVEKVYGKRRANKIAEYLARHEREPYLIKVANPIQLSSLPDPGFAEPPTEEATGDEKPKIIKAPQLPVQ